MSNGDTIEVILQGKTLAVPVGTRLEALLDEVEPSPNGEYVGAWVNGILVELNYTLFKPSNIEFIDQLSREGYLIYMRSLCFVYIRAACEVLDNPRVTIEHSLSGGLYTLIHTGLKACDVQRVEERMREIVAENSPFERTTVSREAAIEHFERVGQLDKVRLLSYRPFNFFHLYRNGWMQDYFYGPMLPSTRYLTRFKLFYHMPGVVLYFPHSYKPYNEERLQPQPKLLSMYNEAKRWASILQCQNISDLNELVTNGGISEFIRVNEALHENKINSIAEEILSKEEPIRVILIAGPSSSGKTTFAHRLAIQLRVLGARPFSISLDNYYRDTADIPLDEDGEPDLEHLQAINVELFNEHLMALIQGDEVQLPTYDFSGGRRVLGAKVRIEQDQPIIIEGIHGLNPDLTPDIPQDLKYLIFVSAMTQINVDDHNRIFSYDFRMLRRMVRDFKYRGASPEQTLSMWPSVLRGERRFILPYQEEADVIFNSSLVYEVAVMKKYAYALTNQIKEDSPYINEAHRIRKFLNYFTSLEDERDVPGTSILREFIGGSCFNAWK